MKNALATIAPNQITLSNDTPLASHPAARYLAGLSESGRRPQRQALNVIASLLTSGGVSDCLALDWSGVRYAHAAAVRSKLAETYKPATANRMLAAFRGVMNAARMLGIINADEWQAITAQKIGALKTINGDTLPAGRALASGEIYALMNDCQQDPTAAGARDAAVIALGYGCGLRRAEITNLDLADFDSNSNSLKFTGKRNKQRTAHVSGGALAALRDWLAIRGNQPGPLFFAVNKGGKIGAARMTTQAIYNLLVKRGDNAGLSHFSPHDMRHTFISDLLDAGADIVTVAKMAGHSNVETTARYDRRPEQAKAKAAGLLHIPYQTRKVKAAANV